MAEGKPMHTARVVVGKPNTQTPIFSNQIQEIVFNPYWNVPTAIKVEAIRPYITDESGGPFGRSGWNTAVLKNNNLRIKIGSREVDPSRLDWNHLDIKTLNIYQPPGPDNVLGNVKFVFPNKHDVYMHDTPQKLLFPRRVRAASHGCVRVENPEQLALILLQQDQGWTTAKVAAAIQHGYDQYVALLHEVPIYITYFTLWVNDDGSISTFGDVYGHDARMAAALFGNRVGFDKPASGAMVESTSGIDN
jgi:murein L,D-transpeptidase YcbB/YkuD